MLHRWTLTLVLALVASAPALAGGKAKNNAARNAKILAQVQKLQGQIVQDNAKRSSELAKASTMWGGKINGAKARATKDNDALQIVRRKRQAGLDAINSAYSVSRTTYVNASAQLKTQHAQLVQQRDQALAGQSGDAYNTINTQYNQQLAAVDVKIVQNNAAWKMAHDQRAANLTTLGAKYDPTIQKLATVVGAANGKVSELAAGRQKALAVINNRHDSQISGHMRQIARLQSQLK